MYSTMNSKKFEGWVDSQMRRKYRTIECGKNDRRVQQYLLMQFYIHKIYDRGLEKWTWNWSPCMSWISLWLPDFDWIFIKKSKIFSLYLRHSLINKSYFNYNVFIWFCSLEILYFDLDLYISSRRKHFIIDGIIVSFFSFITLCFSLQFDKQ